MPSFRVRRVRFLAHNRGGEHSSSGPRRGVSWVFLSGGAHSPKAPSATAGAQKPKSRYEAIARLQTPRGLASIGRQDRHLRKKEIVRSERTTPLTLGFSSDMATRQAETSRGASLHALCSEPVPSLLASPACSNCSRERASRPVIFCFLLALSGSRGTCTFSTRAPERCFAHRERALWGGGGDGAEGASRSAEVGALWFLENVRGGGVVI